MCVRLCVLDKFVYVCVHLCVLYIYMYVCVRMWMQMHAPARVLVRMRIMTCLVYIPLPVRTICDGANLLCERVPRSVSVRAWTYKQEQHKYSCTHAHHDMPCVYTSVCTRTQ